MPKQSSGSRTLNDVCLSRRSKWLDCLALKTLLGLNSHRRILKRAPVVSLRRLQRHGRSVTEKSLQVGAWSDGRSMARSG